MATAESVCSALTTYGQYITNGATSDSNQQQLVQQHQQQQQQQLQQQLSHQYKPDYSSPYLNNLLEPPLNPHDGILPSTSRSYLQQAYLDETNVSMDLSILGTETHDDSRIIEEIRKSGQQGTQGTAGTRGGKTTILMGGLIARQEPIVDMDSGVGSSTPSGDRTRKKSRTHSRGSDEDSGNKKTRGRPRLDTRDETAVDRRRTQIRLAQRAYRLRKETTISSLKKRVSELESAIDDMNKSFLKFNDNAMSSGIMQLRPALAIDLKDTTEQFLSLARVANSDGENDGDELIEDSAEEVERPKPSPSKRQPSKRSKQSAPAPEKQHPDPWGYHVEYEGQERPRNKNGNRPNASRSPESQQEGNPSPGGSNSSISDTTENRAIGTIQNLQHYRAEVPSIDLYSQVFLSQQQHAEPQIPWTFSFQETTFARRLQRAAIERGYHLLLSTNSPPSEVARVFRFAFCFSNRDQTLVRLKEILKKGTNESLEFWQSPVVHLGGAGLHYPRPDAHGDRKNMTDVTQPVRSVGPLVLKNVDGEYVNGAKYKGLSPEMMINHAGYEGEWFDSNDVEYYLRERGVIFDAGSSFAEIDLDASDYFDGSVPSSPGGFECSSDGTMGYRSPLEAYPSEPYNNNSGQGFSSLEDQNVYVADNSSFDAVDIDSRLRNNIADSYFNPNVEKPLRNDGTAMYPSAKPTLPNPHIPGPYGTEVTRITHILNRVSVPIVSAIPVGVPRPGRNGKRVASLDVNSLVEELVRGGVCLGRAPGFRRLDVDTAVRVAMAAF